MSKYRCPVCGATHREMPDQCRLCGQLMGTSAVVGDFSGSRQVVVQRKGLGGIMLFAILGVVVLAVILAYAGLGPGAKQIDEGIAKIGLKPRANGWTELSDPNGRFATDFPSNDRKENREVASPFSTNKANNWTVNLSDETLVTVEYVKLDASGTTSTTAPPATDQPAKPVDAALLQAREMGARMKEYLTNNGAKEVKVTDSGFAGYNAQYIEATRYQDPALPSRELYVRGTLFVRGDTVYLVWLRSIYPQDKLNTTWVNVTQNFFLL